MLTDIVPAQETSIPSLINSFERKQRKFLLHYLLFRDERAAKKHSGAAHSTWFTWRNDTRFTDALEVIKLADPKDMVLAFCEFKLPKVLKDIESMVESDWKDLKPSELKVKQWASEFVLQGSGIISKNTDDKTSTVNFLTLIKEIRSEGKVIESRG